MWQSCHDSSCITGFLLSPEAFKLQLSGGNCNNLSLSSYYENTILLAINHFILQRNTGNEEGGCSNILVSNIQSKRNSILKRKAA